ncbi:MAG TPA: DUF4251 domain-containing protein, partial [Puia sp.]|nr:DUF4251 domain-containing protein [Puia sp.]
MRYLISFLSFLAAAPLTTSAQTVKPLIDTQNYVFVAQSAQPLAGSERPLTENVYYVKITKEKIVSYLPYSGNSRIASTDAVTNA